MPTYLYYTQGILDFQEETTPYSEERLEIRLKRKKHQCPKCESKEITLTALYERDVRGLPMGRIREVHSIYTLHQVYCHCCHERSIEDIPFISHPKARLSNEFERTILELRKPKSGNTTSCFVTAAARDKVFITWHTSRFRCRFPNC